jgi:hypothetical protein
MRLDPDFGPVREVYSRGRSSVFQATVGTSVLTRRLDVVGVSYTFTHASDEVGGIPAPAGYSTPVASPSGGDVLRATSDLERRHALQLHGIHRFGRWVDVGISGRLYSGEPFTPLVDSDVNGDGLANDPAFVFEPGSSGDPGFQRAMAELLDGAPPSTRNCILHHQGRVAARNGCRTPWTATFDLQANLRPPRQSRARALSLTVTASNVLAGVDRLVHGTHGLRGWGDAASVDPVLLRVRGFDPADRAFRYEVNPSFGARVGTRNPARAPFSVTVGGRIVVGSDPARQPFLAMVNSIRTRGRSADEIRRELGGRIPNLPMQVLALDDSLGLGLLADQRTRIQASAVSLGERLAPLADSLASALSAAETSDDPARVRSAWAQIRRDVRAVQDYLDGVTRELRTLLSEEQWNRLPDAVRAPSGQILPPRNTAVGGSELW